MIMSYHKLFSYAILQSILYSKCEVKCVANVTV